MRLLKYIVSKKHSTRTFTYDITMSLYVTMHVMKTRIRVHIYIYIDTVFQSAEILHVCFL